MEKVSRASGAVVDTTTIISCGGHGGSGPGPISSSCFSYGVDKKWIKLAEMASPRDGSASVAIPGGVWMAGGWDGGYDRLNTTELVFLNGARLDGPALPDARSFHCLTQLDESSKYFSLEELLETIWLEKLLPRQQCGNLILMAGKI